MKHTHLFYPCALLATATLLSAQITLRNSAPLGPRYATTTGKLHAIDTTNKIIGNGSVRRSTGTSNASYLNTNIALDPNKGDILCGAGDVGYTIQFWYRPLSNTAFAYIFGDRTWSGASGTFRCFQNGAAGTGNVYIRGPLGQLRTTGAPLTTKTNSAGWVHLAVVQNNKAKTITWYVNGSQDSTTTSTGTGKGKNFTCMGYNGSASGGAAGNYDDIRVYNYARTAADIAGDYTKKAVGSGPSKCPNVPSDGYYECESAVNPHVMGIALDKEPSMPNVRLFTGGDRIHFDVSTSAAGPFPGLLVLNVFPGGPGKPRQDAYGLTPPLPGGPFRTSLIPGFELGSAFSSPTYAGWLLWPGQVSYGGATTGRISATVPTNINMVNGDRLDVQFIAGDPTYPPAGLGATNNCLFEFVRAKGAHGAHIEARGVDRIQDTGFWEIWNTGVIGIKSVEIDFTPITTSTTWDPAGALNSGGTLAAGTSFRHQTDKVCALTPLTNPRYTLDTTSKKLKFTFDTSATKPANGFQGPTNHFVFDCDTNRAGSGRIYIGAKVTVTFADNTTKSGNFTGSATGDYAQVDL